MDRIVSFAACCALAAGVACGTRNASDENPRRTRPSDSGIAVHASTPEDFVHATSDVGLRYGSLPAGFTYTAGSAIPRTNGGARYALSQVATPRGTMLWLETLDGRERLVRAELRVPPLAADERFLIGSCDLNGRLDPRIVAIVVGDSSARRFTSVRQVWRANADAERFEVLPVAGIVCEEPGS